ncbi:MAG: adenylate/guanylate cyclase domain-containing protein [Solirubrobacteraceae bacterium]
MTAIAEIAEPRLRELAEQLDGHRWAAELVDDRWRLVWVSEELRALRGEDEGQIRYGQHLLRSGTAGFAVLAEPSRECWVRTNVPFMLHGRDGDKAAIVKMVSPDLRSVVEELEPQSPPPRWLSTFDFTRDEFFGRVSYIGERVQDEHGKLIGYLFLYTPDLPASLLTLLVRGERSMYERMAGLVEGKLRPAAILFADLESSSALSRRLATAAYFRLISSLRTAFDAAVSALGGIVGKHAGDGVTGFFLSEQLGSDSRAARAALEIALGADDVAAKVAGSLDEDGLALNAADCRLNVGVHWGTNLYIGQVATEGRLEVTALGDAVNEAARIEQSATGGRVLASKPLLERLSPEDASALGLDPARLAYEPVAELQGASEKAARDAGSIGVADVKAP